MVAFNARLLGSALVIAVSLGCGGAPSRPLHDPAFDTDGGTGATRSGRFGTQSYTFRAEGDGYRVSFSPFTLSQGRVVEGIRAAIREVHGDDVSSEVRRVNGGVGMPDRLVFTGIDSTYTAILRMSSAGDVAEFLLLREQAPSRNRAIDILKGKKP